MASTAVETAKERSASEQGKETVCATEGEVE
jgi:hypothetical protein